MQHERIVCDIMHYHLIVITLPLRSKQHTVAESMSTVSSLMYRACLHFTLFLALLLGYGSPGKHVLRSLLCRTCWDAIKAYLCKCNIIKGLLKIQGLNSTLTFGAKKIWFAFGLSLRAKAKTSQPSSTTILISNFDKPLSVF